MPWEFTFTPDDGSEPIKGDTSSIGFGFGASISNWSDLIVPGDTTYSQIVKWIGEPAEKTPLRDGNSFARWEGRTEWQGEKSGTTRDILEVKFDPRGIVAE